MSDLKLFKNPISIESSAFRRISAKFESELLTDELRKLCLEIKNILETMNSDLNDA